MTDRFAPRLIAVIVVALAASVYTAPTGAAAADGDSPTTTADPFDELPDGARTIIGSPDPGPKPEHPGDRGGYAQFLTLGVLVAAVSFIMWRIVRAARAAAPAVSPPGPRRSP
jgi:hypothetical protein